jgi:hypothetical protein
VTTTEYKSALEAAIKEYESLGDERRAIDKRLAELAQTIGTLTRLVGHVPTVPLGITDAVRLVTRAGLPLTPTDVRDRLHAMGFDLSGYASELSAIHTVLKRLNERGELRIVPKPNGRDAYLWQRPVSAVAIGPDVAAFLRSSATFHSDKPLKKKTAKRKK